jgi:hypothetical protein
MSVRGRTDPLAWRFYDALHRAKHEMSPCLTTDAAVPALARYQRIAVSNPWLKKNPFLSMWLSSVNRAAGAVRGQATAQAKRQVNAAVAQALAPSAPKAKPKSVPKRKR